MAKQTYQLSDKTPNVTIEKKGEKGIITYEEVKGIYPFGPQCEMITNENLTDSIAEFLLTKDEFKDFIVKKK
jgi:hypothetical protein